MAERRKRVDIIMLQVESLIKITIKFEHWKDERSQKAKIKGDDVKKFSFPRRSGENKKLKVKRTLKILKS